jgi:hypothetical protein
MSDFSLSRLVSLTCELCSTFCCSRLSISCHHHSLYRHNPRSWAFIPSVSLPILFSVSAYSHFLKDRYVCDVTVLFPPFQFWTKWPIYTKLGMNLTIAGHPSVVLVIIRFPVANKKSGNFELCRWEIYSATYFRIVKWCLERLLLLK